MEIVKWGVLVHMLNPSAVCSRPDSARPELLLLPVRGNVAFAQPAERRRTGVEAQQIFESSEEEKVMGSHQGAGVVRSKEHQGVNQLFPFETPGRPL